MKIAFASTDNIHINQHFGWCERFFIYTVTQDSYSYDKEINSSENKNDEVEKLEYKISSLDNADILYVAQIGPKASMMVQSAGIFSIKSSSEDEKITDAISRLQQLMQEDTPIWLRRIMLKNG